MQVNRRSFAVGFVAIFASASAFAAPHKPTPEPIYKVDTVSATTGEGKLVIKAHGAVNSGGWTNAHLRPKISKEAHVMAFEFVAVPPPPDAAVIEALVPVQAETTATLPAARVSEIRVDTETNEIKAQPADDAN